MKKISVCIPTYNGERYIKQQVSSILSQLNTNDEVIISDDSSIDNTIGILKGMNDDRIKIYPSNTFKSPIFNLENALLKTSGDIIFLSDQDDIWYEDKVKITLKHLEKYDLVVSDCHIIDETNKIVNESFYKINRSKHGYINNLLNNSYLGCCMAFNSNLLSSILPFPKKIAMHDIWIGLISELIGNTIFIPEKLIGYRRHQNNFSSSSEPSKFNILYKIGYRLHFLRYSLSRYISYVSKNI